VEHGIRRDTSKFYKGKKRENISGGANLAKWEKKPEKNQKKEKNFP